MSIRNKLILMLAIPLAALALVGALGFRTQSQSSAVASSALDDNKVVQSINDSIKAIGSERIALVSGQRGLDLAELRQMSDDSLETVTRLAADAGVLPLVTNGVEGAAGDMSAARFSGDLLGAIQEMNSATERLRDIRDRIPVDYPTQETFAEATAVNLAVDIADRQDTVWLEYIASDQVPSDLANELRSEQSATDALREQILEIAPESRTGRLNASLASESDANIEIAGEQAIRRFETGQLPLPDGPTLDAVVATHDDWYGHAILLQDDVEANLLSVTDQAASRQNLFALLATLGLLVLFGLIYVVYRSVVRPLDELLAGAEQVANDHLPSVVSELRTIGSSDANVRLKPLPRESDDELGSLVDAFNDVQLTAFDLAVEQARSRRNIAEMFVNLGRRNQKLLQRMLSVISELEHDEKDPDKLEQLFHLDHMTTRMRRNAESLLVVAGTTTPRQWAKPVEAADVVRSALAEVQDYHRIDILSLEDAPMAGNAVADVTHLLAELLENALQFSEPETRVTITSRWKDNFYRIVISDHGFGMSAEELEENNSLIAYPPPPDEAPTRFLGLFVVGHLADRHGIEVHLTDATIGGTDARVNIPASLMSDTVESARLAPGTDDVELDLDAELAKLTAETDVSDVMDAGRPELPMRGETVAEAAPELPMRGETVAEAAPELPMRGEAVAEAAPELPMRGETIIDFGAEPATSELDLPLHQEVAPPAPAPAPLPTRGEAPAPSAPAPSAPTRVVPAPLAPTQVVPAPPAPAPAAAPVLQPVAEAAPAGQLPVRGEAAPAATGSADLMGLPMRQPKASLADAGAMPADQVPAAASADEPEDVSAAASSVGSMFSAFQAGIQRTERTNN